MEVFKQMITEKEFIKTLLQILAGFAAIYGIYVTSK
jgi:hypothetical protein